jgi:hypothetical protein
MKNFTYLLLLLVSLPSLGQVNSIKSASSNSSGGSSSGYTSGEGSSSGGGSFFLVDLFFGDIIGGVAIAQQHKLQRKQHIPTLISLDVMAQVAAQPSAYYIINPRIRGNWGLFSTDFRLNYIIEEEFEGPVHIRTNDWQILQLNIITTRNVTARVGGGILYEAFSGGKSYSEWTAGFQYHPNESRLGAYAEYRGAEPRKEMNVFAQYNVFDRGRLHGFTTAGVVYQRYYESITTWGIQGGFMFKVY